VNGLSVRKVHNVEVALLLTSVHPAPDPAIRLHGFGTQMLHRLGDPFVENTGAAWALTRVPKVLGAFNIRGLPQWT